MHSHPPEHSSETAKMSHADDRHGNGVGERILKPWKLQYVTEWMFDIFFFLVLIRRKVDRQKHL